MKKHLTYAALFPFLILGLFLSSCSKDDTDDESQIYGIWQVTGGSSIFNFNNNNLLFEYKKFVDSDNRKEIICDERNQFYYDKENGKLKVYYGDTWETSDITLTSSTMHLSSTNGNLSLTRVSGKPVAPDNVKGKTLAVQWAYPKQLCRNLIFTGNSSCTLSTCYDEGMINILNGSVTITEAPTCNYKKLSSNTCSISFSYAEFVDINFMDMEDSEVRYSGTMTLTFLAPGIGLGDGTLTTTTKTYTNKGTSTTTNTETYSDLLFWLE